MKECKSCGYLEGDYNDAVFSCDCKIELNSVDSILSEIEDNFESLWEANK